MQDLAEMQPVFDKWRSTGTPLFFGTEEVKRLYEKLNAN